MFTRFQMRHVHLRERTLGQQQSSTFFVESCLVDPGATGVLGDEGSVVRDCLCRPEPDHRRDQMTIPTQSASIADTWEVLPSSPQPWASS